MYSQNRVQLTVDSWQLTKIAAILTDGSDETKHDMQVGNKIVEHLAAGSAVQLCFFMP